MRTKSFVFTIVIVAVLVLVLVVGLSLGKKQGTKEGESRAEQRFGDLIDITFPKPPSDIKTLSGTVKEIYGATINLEVMDFDDYLPHTDGAPQRREIRFANVSSVTTFTLIDYTKPDGKGNPTMTSIELSNLKIGDKISVWSDENLRDAKKFDVTRVELVKF